MFAAIDAGNARILWAAGERRRLLAAARRAWRSGDKAAHRAARAELAGLPPHRRTVGAATMQRIRATLRSALADAVRQGLVTVNVAKPAKLKTGKRPNALVWGTERVTAWQTAYERELAAERERVGGRHPRCCLHGVMVTMMPIGDYNALTIRADRRSGRFWNRGVAAGARAAARASSSATASTGRPSCKNTASLRPAPVTATRLPGTTSAHPSRSPVQAAPHSIEITRPPQPGASIETGELPPVPRIPDLS